MRYTVHAYLIGWIRHALPFDDLDQAKTKARELQELCTDDGKHVAFKMIEIRTEDGSILYQWVGGPTGYVPILRKASVKGYCQPPFGSD